MGPQLAGALSNVAPSGRASLAFSPKSLGRVTPQLPLSAALSLPQPAGKRAQAGAAII